MKARAYQIILLALLLLAEPAAAAKSWKKLALLVGQNETSRASAMAELRKLKDLDQELLDATATKDRALALDVMSALHMSHLVPRLLELTRSDEDGFLTLTLSSLMNEKNKDLILGTYVENLRPSRFGEHSPAALVAMLEPVGRLQILLAPDAISALLRHEMPEVRSAALVYLRMTALQPKSRVSVDLIPLALKSSHYQVRLQALYLMEELTEKRGIPFDRATIKRYCAAERNPVVKEKCGKMKARGTASAKGRR